MSESKTLQRIMALEEEVEALKRVVQTVLWSEAIEAAHKGVDPLCDGDIPLEFDKAHVQPGDLRTLRVLNRALEILSEAKPSPSALPPEGI